MAVPSLLSFLVNCQKVYAPSEKQTNSPKADTGTWPSQCLGAFDGGTEFREC